jgi:large subunit ribosomal protein L13
MKTFLPNAQAALDNRKWHVVDADGVVLGRLASRVATIIRGKHRPQFTPHLDTGDFVVVINAEKVVLTGKKETDKEFMTYSGWKGGEKFESVAQRRARKPELLIEHAVNGMLPKGRLGRSLRTKLKVYAGGQHPHAAQQPVKLEIKKK